MNVLPSRSDSSSLMHFDSASEPMCEGVPSQVLEKSLDLKATKRADFTRKSSMEYISIQDSCSANATTN